MSRINRRQFLKRSALTAAGLTLSRSHALAFGGVAPQKVIIIGAGMAGLSAAYELTQLGHDVTILEARSRPGGRVHTLREPFDGGLYAEAGAARIPDNHDLTLKYVKLFGLPLEPMYPTQLSALRVDGSSKREVPIDGFTDGLAEYFGSEFRGPTRFSKIKGGNDNLPRAFATRLKEKIRYNSPVVKINQDEKSVRVTFLDQGKPQTITGDRLLCALPFTLLRNIELPASFAEAKRKVISDLHYDSVSRVYLQAKRRSWEEKGLNGFAITKDAVEIWQPTWNQPGPRGIIMTYNRPGQAERIAAMKDPDRITSTLDQLSPLFPGLRENFEKGATKCWVEDEWARGAWAFAGLGNLALFAKPEGRIHFAGEHLSFAFSWMQGALDSSARAVKQINEAGQ
ncbi:MAG TPA: FAD-dependent oxidoreductase [Pyrinomonadaceae bacterium]|nr:FAD-dependent oxidoreductase [Pyrinomonadaceae bacterium]